MLTESPEEERRYFAIDNEGIKTVSVKEFERVAYKGDIACFHMQCAYLNTFTVIYEDFHQECKLH
jgi:hypothetical protein